MDLKIKKYFIEATPGGPSDHHDDESQAPAEAKLVIDSKFRRETNNFKVNFDVSSADATSQAPVLIKYIEKNLKLEELLGLVVAAPNLTYVITAAELAKPWAYKLGQSNVPITIFYVPSTGALSLKGPYVEEEEGGDDGGRVINLDELQYNSKTGIWSGYETGLGVDDFKGAKITADGDTMAVRTVDTASSETGFTIKLVTDTITVSYSPSAGQFTDNFCGDIITK